MLRKMVAALALTSIAAIVSGCGGPKGAAFEGHWTGGTEKQPASLDIKYDDGVFHIDHKQKSFYFDEFNTNKWEATALSDNVLSIDLGVVKRSLRLENGHLFLNNEEFNKAK